MGNDELRERVRREETAARHTALTNAARFTGALVIIILLLALGANTLHQVIPALDLKLARTLVILPIGLFALGGAMNAWEALTHAIKWRKASAIRREVDRHPDQAALVVPPLPSHLDPLKQVASHGRTTARRLAWGSVVLAVFLLFLIAYLSAKDTAPAPTDPTAIYYFYGLLAVLGGVALFLLLRGTGRLRRWQTGRAVRRLSENPALAARVSPIGPEPRATRAARVPPLTVTFLRPRPLQQAYPTVTASRNVLGSRPMTIAYLRLFENQIRVGAFLRAAWREFGYVHLLRSATSVSPAELRHARETNTVADLFVTSPRRFRAAVDNQPVAPLPPGKRTLDSVTDLPLKVLDPYGSYPVRSVLCHVNFWQTGVDLLLSRVDLVVLDLSGYRPSNAGTRFELQRVIDRFPAHRMVLLCDEGSDQAFLAAQIRHHWARMAAGSPNEGGAPREILVAATHTERGFLMATIDEQRHTDRWLATHVVRRLGQR